jgi:outer membrane immunogenic protein
MADRSLGFRIEASLAYARFHERSADVNSAFAAPDINTDKTKLNTLFMSTLQLGYAWDRTLWYVKGGYAASSMSQETITIVPGTGSFIAPTGSRFANGFTVGTGLEFALTNNFSIGVEYDYIRLEASDATTCSTGIPSAFSCGTPGSIALRYTDFHADVNEALVRLNYKFGDRELAPLK